eukprot:CAMPEP_0115854796 /NCGR_PEP_ID=MMETSP0287-20121206/14211_1 /TAXON_ID=412157 /ORGANISM="Chrysochromulina rotalis, Strain UIO044" /LENGTH=76 /DNA_ID=CAMNT_0003308929 /DNA_START=327 /DNA_END=553 /DNA_ORIENTATION=+
MQGHLTAPLAVFATVAGRAIAVEAAAWRAIALATWRAVTRWPIAVEAALAATALAAAGSVAGHEAAAAAELAIVAA